MLFPRWVVFALSGEATSMVFTLFLMFLVFYFLIIRPQARKQKEREAMLKSVQKGDRVVTTSGIYGTVVSTRGDDVLVVKIADNVRVEMARPSVAAIVSSAQDGSRRS